MGRQVWSVVENLMKQSVVAQRVVCEAVKSAGGVSEIKLVNELMTSCSLARQRYTVHLEKAKELKNKSRRGRPYWMKLMKSRPKKRGCHQT